MNPTTIMLVDVKLFVTIKEFDVNVMMDNIRLMFRSIFSEIAFFDVQYIDCYQNIWRFETAVNTKELNKLKLTKRKLYDYIINNIHYAGKYQSLDYHIEVNL